jgi:transcriptional pleiotropic regulator of transition state genes
MKKARIIRRVDELGRIVLPIKLRNQLNFDIKDFMEIYVNGNSIILKKYEKTCVFCGSDKNLIEFNDKVICNKCILNICQIRSDK